MCAGFASSSSAFAALSLAATRALGLRLSLRELSMLARKGSGSACRSIPDGFVEWLAGNSDGTSFAQSMAPPDHWTLRIVTVTFPGQVKRISSRQGHRAAESSPFYKARLAQLPETLQTVRAAIQDRNFDALGMAVEREALSLHCIAMTSRVPDCPHLSGIYYWRPASLKLIQLVQRWRREGLAVYFTMDAGSSIHLLVEQDTLEALQRKLGRLSDLLDCEVFASRPARGARVISSDGESTSQAP
jgi:diphosphomevalonate decarboxylase